MLHKHSFLKFFLSYTTKALFSPLDGLDFIRHEPDFCPTTPPCFDTIRQSFPSRLFPQCIPVHPESPLKESTPCLHVTCPPPHPQRDAVPWPQVRDLNPIQWLAVAPPLELLPRLSEDSLDAGVQIVLDTPTPPLVQTQLIVRYGVSSLQVSEPTDLEHICCDL